MPSHWTYEKKRKPSGDLYQGDIIDRTTSLLKVLGSVHGYFCDPKYLGFIVTSQTCDLVVRESVCKAKYINLAVIRSLESLLPTIIEDNCGTQIPGVYYKDGRGDIKNLVERIINQNEQTHGLFYLEPDGDLKLAVPSVAMLRISIALRSKEHYRIVKAARVGRLRPSFRNKLGWLTGNLYSRVDTPDWPEEIGMEEARKKVDRILSDVDEATANVWVSRRHLDFSISKDASIKSLPREKVKEAIQPFAPPKPSDAVTARVQELTPPLLDVILMTDIKAAAELLKNDRAFARLIADRIRSGVCHLLSTAHLWDLAGRFVADDRTREAAAASVDRFAMEFVRRRCDKDYANLSMAFASRPFFDAKWLTLVNDHLAALELDAKTNQQVIAACRSSRPMRRWRISYRYLCGAGAAKGLGDRLAKRLRNDSVIESLFASEA